MASIKNNKKNKKKHLIGLKEFIFDFLSLVFALVVVLYYGGRCFYYYSAQNQSKNGAVIT